MNSQPWVVLCDFDGTIVTTDTAELVLRKFAPKSWERIEKQFLEGKITLQECLIREYSLVKGSMTEIIAAVGNVTKVRPNFRELVLLCKEREVPLVVVSAGIDFVVRHVLERSSPIGLKTCVPRSRLTSNGIEVEFPKLLDDKPRNFKEDLASYYKRKGKRVVYIGDGTADLPPAKHADIVFSVEGSRLSSLCKRENLSHVDFRDFAKVVNGLKKRLKGTSAAFSESTNLHGGLRNMKVLDDR